MCSSSQFFLISQFLPLNVLYFCPVPIVVCSCPISVLPFHIPHFRLPIRQFSSQYYPFLSCQTPVLSYGSLFLFITPCLSDTSPFLSYKTQFCFENPHFVLPFPILVIFLHIFGLTNPQFLSYIPHFFLSFPVLSYSSSFLFYNSQFGLTIPIFVFQFPSFVLQNPILS